MSCRMEQLVVRCRMEQHVVRCRMEQLVVVRCRMEQKVVVVRRKRRSMAVQNRRVGIVVVAVDPGRSRSQLVVEGSLTFRFWS